MLAASQSAVSAMASLDMRSDDPGHVDSVSHRQGRLVVVGQCVHRRPQHPAVPDDAHVGPAQVFPGAVLDRAHAFDRPLVVHVDVEPHARPGQGGLLFRIEPVAVAPVLERRVVGQAVLLHPLLSHQLLVDRLVEAREQRVPVAVLVIDRNVPLGDRHLAAHRDADGAGEDLVRDPHVGETALHVPEGGQLEAEIGLLDPDLGARVLAQEPGHRDVGFGRAVAELPAVAVLRVFVLEEAMQEGGMGGVDADLERLQPVALPQTLEREDVGLGRPETVEAGKIGRLVRAHVREDDAVLLDHRIGGRPDALVHLRALGLARLLDALPIAVIVPAVKGAAKTVVFAAPEAEIRAAVEAMPADEAQLALVVAEQHQPLAEQRHRHHRALAVQLLDEGGRLPVSAQHLAGGPAPAGAGEPLVEFLADHGSTPDDSETQESLSHGSGSFHHQERAADVSSDARGYGIENREPASDRGGAMCGGRHSPAG